MMNQIVGHLTQAALCRGYSHLFLYTKPKNARLFEPLGFFPIAQVPELVFMENRRHGFSDYLHALQAQAPCLPGSAFWRRLAGSSRRSICFCSAKNSVRFPMRCAEK